MSANATVDAIPVLALQGISIEAGGRLLIAGLNLDLHSGELAGICGPSGCGKSTLLRAIAGLIPAAAGQVLLQGIAPRNIGWPVFRRRVILVSQRPVLFDGTAWENLARPFFYHHAPGPFPENDAWTLLDQLGIERERAHQSALSLSIGQQQRICLVRALLLRPAVLLLDEPSSALDEASVTALEQTISDWARDAGGSALVVSHDRAQVARWCGRAVDLKAFQPGSG